jgi:flagellar basal body-associated protein FliL
MSHNHTPIQEKPRSSTGILLFIGVLILMIAAVLGGLWLNRSGSVTETEDANRAAIRAKNLAELQSADTTALTTYGWNDKAKGIIHLPITKAMELVLPSLQASEAKEQP